MHSFMCLVIHESLNMNMEQSNWGKGQYLFMEQLYWNDGSIVVCHSKLTPSFLSNISEHEKNIF